MLYTFLKQLPFRSEHSSPFPFLYETAGENFYKSFDEYFGSFNAFIKVPTSTFVTRIRGFVSIILLNTVQTKHHYDKQSSCPPYLITAQYSTITNIKYPSEP